MSTRLDAPCSGRAKPDPQKCGEVENAACGQGRKQSHHGDGHHEEAHEEKTETTRSTLFLRHLDFNFALDGIDSQREKVMERRSS